MCERERDRENCSLCPINQVHQLLSGQFIGLCSILNLNNYTVYLLSNGDLIGLCLLTRVTITAKDGTGVFAYPITYSLLTQYYLSGLEFKR